MNRRLDGPRRPGGPALVACAALGALLAFGGLRLVRAAEAAVSASARALAPPLCPVPPATLSLPPAPLRLTAATARIARNQTLSQALSALRLSDEEVRSVLDALRGLLPFRRLRAGDQVRVERREGGALHRLSVRQGPADEWLVHPADGGGLRGEKRPVALETEVVRVAVTIHSSLYETLEAAGVDPSLAVAGADALAWDVDFYQDVRDGDRMKVLVERQKADGRFLRWGEVLAAEYDGSAVGKKRLFLYVDPGGRGGYYDEEGQSAQRGFLRSPLRYSHLTSRFGNRRHPILGYTRAHEGVDYGAPVGTPVWSVGDGAVRQAGWNGGCGRSVTVRHRNGYGSVYCHLSRVAVRPGAQVSQKQVVGYVGQTGLATGPHLHYALRRAGRFVNPLSLRLPRGAPVPEPLRADFAARIASLRERLDAEPVASR